MQAAFDPVAELELTEEQVGNLRKLSAYLLTLPVDYPKFAMSSFTSGDDGGGGDTVRVPECGTAACAAGHGPTAGVDPEPGETWAGYSYRAFIDYGDGWDWLFSACWAEVDNSAHGAAARIDYLLAHGLPDNYWNQMVGDEPISYRELAS